MNSDNIATINDYEHTIEELRRTRSELNLQIDTVVEVLDGVCQMNRTLWKTIALHDDITQMHQAELAEIKDKCARLTSDNERLRIALQTGEQ